MTGLLDLPSPLLELKPLFPGGRCSLRSEAAFWFLESLSKQVVETRNRIQAILILRAVPPRFDDQHAIGGHALARQVLEAQLDLGREGCRCSHAETELSSSGHLIDILAARARAADKVEGELGVAKAE